MNKFNNENRSVIGYDLRERWSGDVEFAATIDMQLWKEHSKKYTSYVHVNGINLLSKIESFLFDIEGSCLIAIDVPSWIAIKISSTFGINVLPLISLSEKEWEFLGFDIADIYTQSSVLYSFDSLVKMRIKKKFNDNNIDLNKYGLLTSIPDFLTLSAFFNKLIPEHVPFVPCGIWLSSHSTNKFHS